MANEDRGSSGLGYLSVAAAAGLWAASGAASKFLFSSGMTPLQLVQLRTTIAAFLLVCWMLIRRGHLLSIGRKDLGYFALIGIVLAAAQFTYLYAISRIHVAAAILLQYQAPVLIAAHAIAFGHKKLSPVTMVAIAGAVFGCYLMVGAYDTGILKMNSEGVIAGLASAVAFSIYSVRTEYGMRRYSPLTMLCYALIFSSVAWNIIHPPLAAFSGSYSIKQWSSIIYVGLFGTIIPFGLYSEGIRRVQATRASITATLEPVIAGMISYVMLDEVLASWQIVGAGFVIASILILQIRKDPVAFGTRSVT